MTSGVWTNGKRRITGRWQYNYPSDTFTIILDSMDRITGQPRMVTVHDESPEWGKWRLAKPREGET